MDSSYVFLLINYIKKTVKTVGGFFNGNRQEGLILQLSLPTNKPAIASGRTSCSFA